KILEITPDEKWIIAAGDAPYILLLDLENLKSVKLEIHKGTVTNIVVPNNTGHFYSLGVEDNTLKKNDFSGNVVAQVVEEDVRSLTISSDGKYLLGGTESGEIIVWNAENLERVYSAANITNQPVYSLTINNANSWLAVGDESGGIY